MPPPRPYLAFVAVEGSEGVAAIDLGSFQPVKVIPLGFAPDRLIVRPHSRDVYATSADGDVAAIQYPQLSSVKLWSGGGVPPDLRFSEQGRTAYGIDEEGHALFTLDCQSGKIEAQHAMPQRISRLALTPDGKTLLAIDTATGKLLFVEAKSGRVLGALAIGKSPGDLVILPGSRKAFIADSAGDMIAALQIPARELLSDIQLSASPTLLALKPDGGEIFAFSNANSTMTVLDASSDAVEESFAAAGKISAAMFTKDSSMLYAASATEGDVIALNVSNRRVMTTTHVGIEPVALALTPDERFLAVVDAAAGRLAIMRGRVPAYPKGAISELSQAVYGSSLMVATIPVGPDPVAIVIPGWLWPPQAR